MISLAGKNFNRAVIHSFKFGPRKNGCFIPIINIENIYLILERYQQFTTEPASMMFMADPR
jgi:hypothetical protein